MPNKDRIKRMVQNYQYLNSWTNKNNYPLLLISILINIGKKVSTKIWGYNIMFCGLQIH